MAGFRKAQKKVVKGVSSKVLTEAKRQRAHGTTKLTKLDRKGSSHSLSRKKSALSLVRTSSMYSNSNTFRSDDDERALLRKPSMASMTSMTSDVTKASEPTALDVIKRSVKDWESKTPLEQIQLWIAGDQMVAQAHSDLREFVDMDLTLMTQAKKIARLVGFIIILLVVQQELSFLLGETHAASRIAKGIIVLLTLVQTKWFLDYFRKRLPCEEVYKSRYLGVMTNKKYLIEILVFTLCVPPGIESHVPDSVNMIVLVRLIVYLHFWKYLVSRSVWKAAYIFAREWTDVQLSWFHIRAALDGRKGEVLASCFWIWIAAMTACLYYAEAPSAHQRIAANELMLNDTQTAFNVTLDGSIDVGGLVVSTEGLNSTLLLSGNATIVEEPIGLPILSIFEALWVVIQVVTTLGYGDYVVTSSVARVVVMVCAIGGLVLSSLTIATISAALEFSEEEASIIFRMGLHQEREMIRIRAANLLANQYLIKKARREYAHFCKDPEGYVSSRKLAEARGYVVRAATSIDHGSPKNNKTDVEVGQGHAPNKNESMSVWWTRKKLQHKVWKAERAQVTELENFRKMRSAAEENERIFEREWTDFLAEQEKLGGLVTALSVEDEVLDLIQSLKESIGANNEDGTTREQTVSSLMREADELEDKIYEKMKLVRQTRVNYVKQLEIQRRQMGYELKSRRDILLEMVSHMTQLSFAVTSADNGKGQVYRPRFEATPLAEARRAHERRPDMTEASMGASDQPNELLDSIANSHPAENRVEALRIPEGPLDEAEARRLKREARRQSGAVLGPTCDQPTHQPVGVAATAIATTATGPAPSNAPPVVPPSQATTGAVAANTASIGSPPLRLFPSMATGPGEQYVRPETNGTEDGHNTSGLS